MMIRFLRRWGPSLVMIAVIFALSSIPLNEMPALGHWDTIVKKGGHALGYGLLALAFWRGCEWRKGLFWLPLLLSVLYAATDELHQSFVPGRHPSPIDVGIDALGSSIVLGLWAWFRAVRAKRDRPAAQEQPHARRQPRTPRPRSQGGA